MLVGKDGVLPLPWLRNALDQAALLPGHALLLFGGDGRGLLELVMSHAQATLCAHDEPAARPCGRCEECHLVQTHIHPDLHVLMPAALKATLKWQGGSDDEAHEKGTKPSQDIRIDEMRMAVDWGSRTVARARAKVMVVHPATRMNSITANALLKTLEEPPGLLKLILTARHPGDLLPTIASRCQHLHLPLPTRPEALAWLAAQGVVDAEVLLDAAGGEPVAARDMAAQGIDARAWRDLPARVKRGDAAALAGWSVVAGVDALSKLCHDSMCAAAGAEPRYFEVKVIPKGASWEALRQWSMELMALAAKADHPWQAALALDALVSRASRVWSP